MNDLPRHTLARIIAKHGRGICAAPKRVEALLKDLAGAHRREINIIVGALEERVAADLIAAGQSVPRDVLLARLAARLRDHLAYTPEAARWGVEAWAVALGVLSEAELQERARAEAEAAARRAAPPPPPPVRPAPPPPVREPQPPSVNPPSVAPRPPRPQRGTTHAPPPPRPQPPPPPTPPTLRPPAPVQRRTPAPPPPRVTLPVPPRQHDPHPSPRRGLSLRGCFVLFVLIAVLVVAAVFVVPVVIGILQEEQARPSINEPRIR